LENSFPEHPESRLIRFAQSLGRPLARGYLNPNQAEAAILAFSLRSARDGGLTHDPIDVARIAQHVARLNAHNIVGERNATIGAIRRAVRPLIEIRASSSRIRAAAHDANGRAGFPLTEAEVEEVAKIEAWRFIQRDGEGRQYG
jgi:hypothetical protein